MLKHNILKEKLVKMSIQFGNYNLANTAYWPKVYTCILGYMAQSTMLKKFPWKFWSIKWCLTYMLTINKHILLDPLPPPLFHVWWFLEKEWNLNHNTFKFKKSQENFIRFGDPSFIGNIIHWPNFWFDCEEFPRNFRLSNEAHICYNKCTKDW